MNHCDLSFPSPQENLACDEALFDLCEEGQSDELLRLWEPSQYFVVLGYANKAAIEANLQFCELNTIPVLRRCTGGGTILQGPGCLNYSLILRISDSPPFNSIAATNEHILNRHRTALASLLKAPIEVRGCTDLALGGLKFCGNAQRRKKHCLLFHGSLLLHLDIELLEKILPMPSKQPDYRVNRSHPDFLMNLKVPASMVKTAFLKCWAPSAPLANIPFERINLLAREKYGAHEWNFKF